MNIIDLLCERHGLHGNGKYVGLANLFRVSRQSLDHWKLRNSIPKRHWRSAMELGATLEELLSSATTSTAGAAGTTMKVQITGTLTITVMR